MIPTLYFRPALLRAPLLLAMLAAAGAGLAGCAARVPEPVGSPVADPAGLAEEVLRATTPSGPKQATFAWSLDEAGSRVRGRGAVRYVAPERLRLDLFGPRGETYLAAAAVGDEYRLPPTVARESVPLPSPTVLWAGLGVVRPPEGARLERATADDSIAVLAYLAPGGETFTYRLRRTPDTLRLRSVERIGRSGVLESVRLEYSPTGELTRARYRDLAAFRELILESETITDVPSFPESIWRPGAS